LPDSNAREDFIDEDVIGRGDIDLGLLDQPRDEEEDTSSVAEAEDNDSSAWPAIITLAAMGAIALLTIGGSRFAWEYGLAGLPRPAQFWEKTQRLARWGKAGAAVSETPREFAARLRRDVEGAGDIGVLAAAYERNRFGQKDLSEDEAERLDAAWISVRNSLLRRVFRIRTRAR
jgi:hypothetical protein